MIDMFFYIFFGSMFLTVFLTFGLIIFDLNRQNTLLREQAIKRNGIFVKGSMRRPMCNVRILPKIKFVYNNFSFYILLKDSTAETNIFVPLILPKGQNIWIHNRRDVLSFIYIPGIHYHTIQTGDIAFGRKFVIKGKNAEIDFIKTLFTPDVNKALMACSYPSLDIAVHSNISYYDVGGIEGLHLWIKDYPKTEDDYDELINIATSICDRLKESGFTQGSFASRFSRLDGFFER